MYAHWHFCELCQCIVFLLHYKRDKLTDLPNSGWFQWGVRIKLTPRYNKSVIYNGLNNFIDCLRGEREGTVLNQGLFFNSSSSLIRRARGNKCLAVKSSHLIHVVFQHPLYLSTIWPAWEEGGEESKTSPAGPPPLLPLQERGSMTCSGEPQLKLPLPLEGKPFYCVPLR